MPRCKFPCSTTNKCCRIKVKNAGDTCHVHIKIKALEEAVVTECPCCFEDIKKNECVVTPCDHKFHHKCLTKWATTQPNTVITCPSCRAPLDEAFQWPKTIATTNTKWRIRDKEMAISVVQALLEDGQQIADEFFDRQNLVFKSLLDSNNERPEGCRVFELTKHRLPANWVGPPLILKTSVQVGKYAFSINVPVVSLGLVDLLDDFNQLLKELTLCLSGHALTEPIF